MPTVLIFVLSEICKCTEKCEMERSKKMTLLLLPLLLLLNLHYFLLFSVVPKIFNRYA